MSITALRSIILVCVAYVAAQMIADVTSLKIAFIAGLSIDAGTLVYPFTFTLRDMVHKLAGISVARLLIIAAAAVNVIMALLFWIAAQLPPDMSVGTQDAFTAVLSPVWRIVIASIIAEVTAELVDTEAYRLWSKRFGSRYQWGRVLSSNAISVPMDSALFVLIAFAGVLPPDVVFSIFVANVLIKGAVTLISLPGIYAVKERDPRLVTL